MVVKRHDMRATLARLISLLRERMPPLPEPAEELPALPAPAPALAEAPKSA